LQYTQAEAKVVNYYENMRVVYEMETRVQQLRKAVAPQNNPPSDNKPDQQNQKRPAPNNREEQEENSSQPSSSGVIAASILQLRGAQL
jgi:heme-binding NEAT domain protein